MLYNVPTTIPSIHYAPYSYSEFLSHPSSKHQHRTTQKRAPVIPPPNTNLYDQLSYNCDLLRAKCRLLNLIRQNKLASLPVGFPFHCVSDYGSPTSARISHESYQFRELFYVSNHVDGISDEREPRLQEATFVFNSPERVENGNMSWRIYLSARGSESRSRDSPKPICLAHVECPAMIFETSFGIDLSTNPLIILKALAISIERGTSLSFHIVKKNSAKFFSSYSWDNTCYLPGEVVLMETDRKGRPAAVLSVESDF